MRTHGRLELRHGAWVIDADPHVHMRAKRVFGRLSTEQAGILTLTHTPEICRDLEWFCDRYPLALSDEDRQILHGASRQHQEQILALEAIIDPSYTPQTFALALPPRSYQAREAEIYLRHGSLLIGDDVGLGKTAAAICSLTDTRTLPAVVVTLTHLPRQWEAEIAKFAPALTVHRIAKGTPYELPRIFGRGPDVLILNYHKLAGWAKVLASYARSVVFDEVQELRHNGSNRYSAAAYLAQRLPFRLGLSATPIYNYGGEIYNVLNILKPNALGSSAEFYREWCAERGGEKSRLKDPKAFGTWAREQFLMIRHTRRDVGRELPDVIKVPHPIDADTAELARVKGTAAELARLILETGATPRGAKWQAAEQLSTVLRQATGIAKAPFVADFVRLLLESGERVVLCGWHREVYGIWQAKLHDFRPRLYTGTETPAQKDAAARAFIAGETPLLILSLRSGAGLDGLQQASSCIVFGELDWSPGVHEQCIGRLARDGQQNPVVAYFLVADHGADPAIAEVLGVKRQQIEGIRNPSLDFLEQLDTSGTHTRRLAESYLRQIGQRVPDLEATA